MPDDQPYVYFGIFGSRESSFDPAEFSEQSGVMSTSSGRKGHSEGRVTLRNDYWKLAVNRDNGLAAQISDLMKQIASPRFQDAVRAHRNACNVRLQFVVWTGREPIEIALTEEDVAIVSRVGAEVDFDLYYSDEPSFDRRACETCHIRLPLNYERVRPYIGGYTQVAEIQLKFRVYDVDGEEARTRFDLDCEGMNLYAPSIAYLERDRCLQFSSHFVPTSGIEAITPARWMRRFVREMHPYIPMLPTRTQRTEFAVELVERGDVQGSAALSLEPSLLRWLSKRQAEVTVRLEWLPQPHFSARGKCMHCGIACA